MAPPPGGACCPSAGGVASTPAIARRINDCLMAASRVFDASASRRSRQHYRRLAQRPLSQLVAERSSGEAIRLRGPGVQKDSRHPTHRADHLRLSADACAAPARADRVNGHPTTRRCSTCTPALWPACRSSVVSPTFATRSALFVFVSFIARRMRSGAGRPCVTSSPQTTTSTRPPGQPRADSNSPSSCSCRILCSALRGHLAARAIGTCPRRRRLVAPRLRHRAEPGVVETKRTLRPRAPRVRGLRG